MIIIIALVLFLGAQLNVTAAPKVFPVEVAEEFGQLEIFHNGRVTSVNCFADEYVRKVYGKRRVEGYTSTQVLSGWMFYYDTWKDVPVHKEENRYLMDNVASGMPLAVFPYVDETGLVSYWYSPAQQLPEDIPSDEWIFMRRVITVIGEMVFRGQDEQAIEYLQTVHKYQLEKLGSEAADSKTRKMEELYSAIGMTKLPAIVAIMLGLVLFVLSRGMDGRKMRFVAYLLALYPASLLLLRALILQGVPMKTGAEFMQAIALAALLFAAIGGRKNSGAVAQGLLAGGFAMLVASLDISSPQLGAVSDALQSPYLPFHVGCIMLSYTQFALICLNSISALFSKDRHAATKTSRKMMYPAIIMLAVGTIIGSFWAKEAWGAYWSWDPKETWALITLIIYSFSICNDGFKLLKNDKAYNLFCIFAFIAVLFTYFGVNYILGGMHSYA